MGVSVVEGPISIPAFPAVRTSKLIQDGRQGGTEESAQQSRLSNSRPCCSQHLPLQVPPDQGRRMHGQDRQQWVGSTADPVGHSTADSGRRVLKAGRQHWGGQPQGARSADISASSRQPLHLECDVQESEFLNCQIRHMEKLGT